MKKSLLGFLIFIALSAFASHGFADEVFFQNGINNIDDIVNALAPSSSDLYKTRGIHTAVNAQKKAISLAINFNKNSHDLTPDASNVLDMLGQSLNKEKLKEFNFIVQGHTDASGAKDYNMALSNRRAETVRSYLTTKYNINTSRLVTEGKGETELFDKNAPYSAVNRRVRIINAGR
jgi:outer membrane protein OmpA-like peptidoglycan-associated protein